MSGPPARRRILVVVLAGGAGGRLGPLTERRAKPALPVAGMFRLVDIALSNVANSRMEDVWVVEQYEPHDLNEHLANGRPWDLDRTHGGLRILPPFRRRTGDDAMAEGNVDALVTNRRVIGEFGPDVVVTMSADHLCRVDLRDVVDAHVDAGAELTAVTTEVPPGDDPTRFAWMTVGDGGQVVGFEHKPDDPGGDRVCTEVFAYDATTLLEHLERLDGGEPAGDYGDALVPDLVAAGGVIEYRLPGAWRDVGTIDAYHRAHMELVADHPPFDLTDPSWPWLTGSIIGGPARAHGSASVQRCLLAPGAVVAGAVAGSVLGRDVVVEAGATVIDAVLLDGAVIRTGARVDRAIVDVGCDVGPDDAGRCEEGSTVTVHAAPVS